MKFKKLIVISYFLQNYNLLIFIFFWAYMYLSTLFEHIWRRWASSGRNTSIVFWVSLYNGKLNISYVLSFCAPEYHSISSSTSICSTRRMMLPNSRGAASFYSRCSMFGRASYSANFFMNLNRPPVLWTNHIRIGKLKLYSFSTSSGTIWSRSGTPIILVWL